jgi:hypothetical protein
MTPLKLTASAVCLTLSFTVLSNGGVAIASSGSSSTKPTPPKHVSVPSYSVMEWFSVRTPAPGQKDVVYARLFARNRPVKGARMFVTVRLGKRVVASVQGGTTNPSGQAEATFRIPPRSSGKRLQVLVSLRVSGHSVTGINTIQVK